MKLIVQIPCFNEAETLAATVADIPREISGVDCVEVLVIDDGSHDDTSVVARQAGVEHVVRHSLNRGLAAAFRTGLEASLRLGADIIVNTDADNQYVGSEIPRLIQPILAAEADLVVGDRQTARLAHFSPAKRWLQWLGSWLVRRLSHTRVPDAVSGFRAISREAALKLNVLSSFSYTIETLIQAGNQRMRVVSIPVRTRETRRPSRLFRGMPQFLLMSGATMLRSFAMYRPLTVFASLGVGLGIAGIIPIVRFLILNSMGRGSGHIQSLVLGAALVVLGGLCLLSGILADLIASTRRLIEHLMTKIRGIELELTNATSDAEAADDRSPVLSAGESPLPATTDEIRVSIPE